MNNVVDFNVERAYRKSGIKDRVLIKDMLDFGYDPMKQHDVKKFWKAKKQAKDLGLIDFDLVDFDSFMKNNTTIEVININTDENYSNCDFEFKITYDTFEPDK